MKTKLNGILTLLLALVVQVAFAQQTVTGTVTDPSGEPIFGATVQVKDTRAFTTTDFDGKYTIEASPENTLVFSYTGYDAAQVLVGNQTTIDVKLKTSLDEIVVVAYGSQKRDDMVSAVSVVNSERIEQVPIASLDQALQGAAPGVDVSVSSGQPGRRGNVVIRGRGSINGDVNPLYIIDGVPSDADGFRSLNNNDIDNVSILKDAAATAPYGNRAANGVILVTTKRGTFNSPLRIQYRALSGFSEAFTPKFTMMSTTEFLTFSRDVVGRGQFSGFTDAEIAALPNTDWQDVLFRRGNTNSHEVNFTQGTEKTRSYTSLGYFDQEGIVNRSQLERFTFRNNYSNESSEKFDYNTQVTLNYSRSDFIVDADRDSNVFGANTGGQLDNPFIVPYISFPFYNAFNPDGSRNIIGTQFSGALNADGSINANGANGFRNTPFLAQNEAAFDTDRESEFKGIATGQANWHINSDFTLGSRLGINYTNIEELNITSPLGIRGLLTPDATAQFKGQQTEAYVRNFVATVNPYLNFNKSFGKHTVNASLNGEYNYDNFQVAFLQAFGLNPNLPGSGSGFTDGNVDPLYIPNVGSSESEIALYSGFLLANYDFDGKYGLNVNVRRDGSSRFREENRWGTFYSVGARWNLHNEKFMEDVSAINTLKLRASYGKVGNQNIGSRYVGFERISTFGAYQGLPGTAPTALVADDLQWETTDQLNIGVDFGFFEDRLSGSLEVYDYSTDNLFFNAPVSESTGFTTVTRNVAGLNNRGIELGLNVGVVRGEDFNFDVFANVAYNENEITSLSANSDFLDQGRTALQVGEALRSFYAVEWAGVNPANGQPLYRRPDGTITESFSNADREFIGKTADPNWVGGFGTNIAYKGFSLNTLFSFQADRWRRNGSLGLIEDSGLAAGGITNLSNSVLRAWQQPGDITDIPSVNSPSTRNLATTRYIEDASFVRLRNVTLSYSLQQGALESIGFIKGLRVYAQGTNLVTWSKWSGFDPENSGTDAFFDYPVVRQYTFGLDLTL